MAKKPTYEELEKRVQELEGNIFERSKVQTALLESEAKYRNLIEQLPSAIYLAAVDESSTTLFVSPQIEESLGFEPDEWRKDRDIWLMQIHSDDRERVLAEVEASHKSGGPFLSEYRMFRRDGRTIWVRDQAKIVQDDAGRPLLLQGMISDITEHKLAQEALQKAYDELERRVEERTFELKSANRKLLEGIETRSQAERALREAETRYHAFFNKGPDGVVILDTTTLQPIEFNDQVCRQLGYSRHEFGQLRLSDIEVKENEEEARAHIQKVIKEGYDDFETLHRTKQGEIRHVHVTAQTIDIGSRSVYHCIWRDITDRKQAEEALRASEAEKQAILDASMDMIMLVDTDLRIIWANKTAAAMVGRYPRDLMGHTCHKVFQNLDQPCPCCPTVEAIRTGKPTQKTMYQPAMNTVGETYWEDYCVPVQDDSGHVVGAVETARNITDRKKDEKLLRESEEKFRSLVEQAAEMLFLHDLEGNLVDVNSAAAEHTGYTKQELKEMTVFDIDPDALARDDMQKYWESIKPGDSPVSFEVRHKKGDGSIYLAEVTASKVVFQNTAYILGLARDITERKKAEAALHESEEKYRILFNAFPSGITVSDKSGKIVEANDTAAKLLGISRDEHMSRSIDSSEWRIIDPTGAPMPPENYASVRALKENRLIENVEMGILKPDGKTTWISATASPVPLENYGVVVTYGDITDRKRIEQEYQTLFREMIDGFAVHEIICNERGEPVDYRFLAVNPAFERQTQLKAEDIIGKTVKEVLPNTEPYWVENYGRVALTGESITFENYSQELDRHFYVTAFRPAINYFACIFVDITERKRSEEALLESEKKYRLLADNVRDVIWIRDLDLKLTFVSPSIEVFSGYTVEEALNRNLADVLTPGSARLAVETLTDAMQNLKSGKDLHDEYEIDLEHISKDGRKLWMQCKISPLKDDKGKVVGMLGVSRDITDRKEAERALWESEEKFRLTFSSSPDSVNINRLRDGLYIDINEGFTLLTGFTRQDVIGRTSEEIQIWADMADRSKLVRMLEEKGICENLEARFRRKDGSLTTALMSARVISLQGEPHIISITRDISDRIEAEEAIRKSEEEHRSILKTAMDGFCLIDFSGQLIEVNEAYCQMSGYNERELLSMSISDLEASETEQDTIANSQRVIEHGEDRFETVQRRKDGKLFNVEVSVQYNANDEGRFIAFLRDITERKKAEEALRQIAEKYQQIFENIQDVYYESGLDGTILEVSPSIEKISKYRREELLGKSLYDIYENPEERAGFIREILGRGKVNEYEISLTDQDGSVRACSVTTSVVKNDQGEPVKLVGSMRDISERKQSEKERRELKERLYRAQKMEAMGLLAGGVAHDLNNILSGIVSYPELILMDLPEDSPLRKPITTIHESGMRAADVVADLLTIARGVATGKETLNLNIIVNEYVNSPEFNKLEKLHTLVDFRTELNKDLLNMKGSPVHLKKVLMNLVVNAAEAIEKSGTVTISTCNRYLDEPLMGYENVRRGEYTVLSVSDDGSGISSVDIGRIFEPFYTKKVMGRSGTGLGLAVVWNTVQDHKGYVNVKSSHMGTTFELYFPVTREDIAEKKDSIRLEEYMGHGENILVVDDEETQREIATGILNKLGYHADAVSSGEKAIAYVKEHSVDMIVLDMVMPKGINGRETYEQIIKIRPGQKAIVASGYAETEEVTAAQSIGAGKYIKKPYTLEKIGIAVKEELEK